LCVAAPSGHDVPVRITGNPRQAYRVDYTPVDVGKSWEKLVRCVCHCLGKGGGVGNGGGGVVWNKNNADTVKSFLSGHPGDQKLVAM
jgi:hypothetical protein